ncbi:MAG: hypothetical protein ACFB3T_01990 [Geminicoccaceae bacterium]
MPKLTVLTRPLALLCLAVMAGCAFPGIIAGDSEHVVIRHGGSSFTHFRSPDRIATQHCGTYGLLAELASEEKDDETGVVMMDYACVEETSEGATAPLDPRQENWTCAVAPSSC